MKNRFTRNDRSIAAYLAAVLRFRSQILSAHLVALVVLTSGCTSSSAVDTVYGSDGPPSNELAQQLERQASPLAAPQQFVGTPFSIAVPYGSHSILDAQEIQRLEVYGHVYFAIASPHGGDVPVEYPSELASGEWQFFLSDLATIHNDPETPRLQFDDLVANYGGYVVTMAHLGTDAVLFEGGSTPDAARLGLAWIDPATALPYVAFFVAPSETDSGSLLAIIDSLERTT